MAVDLNADAQDDDEITIDVEDESTEDDENEDGGESWTPPTQAEFKRLQRSLNRANAQAKKLRESKGTDKDKPAQTEDPEQLKREGAVEAETLWKPRFVKQAARAAFAESGVKVMSDRLWRLIDLDEVDVDEDGEIDGLQEQIDDLKSDMPELFGGNSTVRTGKNVDTGDKGSKGAVRSNEERLARQLVGKR